MLEQEMTRLNDSLKHYKAQNKELLKENRELKEENVSLSHRLESANQIIAQL